MSLAGFWTDALGLHRVLTVSGMLLLTRRQDWQHRLPSYSEYCIEMGPSGNLESLLQASAILF